MGAVQQRLTLVTTAGDEMQIAASVVALQTSGHVSKCTAAWLKVFPPFAPKAGAKEWGTLAFCIGGILPGVSSH